jgi:outer membrane protein
MLRLICIVVLWGGMCSVYAGDLTLAEAIALAEDHAVELQSLRANMALAESRHQQTAQAFLPRVSVDSTWFRSDSSLLGGFSIDAYGLPQRTILPDLGPVEGTISGVQLIQPLINIDAFKSRRQAARGMDARHHSYAWGRQRIRLQVVALYYDVAVHQLNEAWARQALEAAQEARRLADAAYRQGMVAKLDRLRADSELHMRRARVVVAESDLKKARLAFKALLGLSPLERVELSRSIPELFPPQKGVLHSEVRSDLLAGKAAYEAAAAGLEKEQAGRLPRMNLLARQQWFDGKEPVNHHGNGWLVAVQLKWDLFDGLGRQGRIAEASARKRLAQLAVEQTKRDIGQEQAQILAEWQAAWSAVQASELAVKAAEEALRFARRGYEEGVGSMTDLLDSQSALYERRLEHSRYRYQLLMAAMNYYLRQGLDPLTPLEGRIGE